MIDRSCLFDSIAAPAHRLASSLLAQTSQPLIDYDAWRLTPSGWAVMLISVLFVTVLMGWCIYRVLRESDTGKVHSQIDIEPADHPE